MSNILARGMATLTEKMEAFASAAVTYRRGATAITWHATIGRKLLKTTDSHGVVRTQLTERDFTGPADELAAIMPPADGDTIDAVLSGVTKRFTLRPVSPTEPCWAWSDEQGETSIRVHTKQTGTV